MIVTNFVFKRGKTFTFNVTCTSGGVAFDLTGATLKFLAKYNITDLDASAVIALTTPTGIVVAAPTTGVAQVQILTANTSGLTNVETVLHWELQVTSATNSFTVASGLITVEPAAIVASP